MGRCNMKNAWYRFLLWLTGTGFWRWLITGLLPRIRFSTSHGGISGRKFLKLSELLEPGDLILAYDNTLPTAFLVPGEFSHGALCISNDLQNPWQVSEMTHEGYTKSAFYDVCRRSSRVAIYRCFDWDEAYVNEVIRAARELDGASYDAQFRFGVKQLYCFELLYQSDVEKRLKWLVGSLPGLGIPYVNSGSIIDAPNTYLVVDSSTV